MQLKKLAAIFLMGTTLILSACAQDFPRLHVHILSVKNGFCTEYDEISVDPLRFDKDHPHRKALIECDGYYALPSSDVAAIRAWYDAKRKAAKAESQ